MSLHGRELSVLVVQSMNDDGNRVRVRDLSSFPKSFLRLPSFSESRAISSGVTVHEKQWQMLRGRDLYSCPESFP